MPRPRKPRKGKHTPDEQVMLRGYILARREEFAAGVETCKRMLRIPNCQASVSDNLIYYRNSVSACDYMLSRVAQRQAYLPEDHGQEAR